MSGDRLLFCELRPMSLKEGILVAEQSASTVVNAALQHTSSVTFPGPTGVEEKRENRGIKLLSFVIGKCIKIIANNVGQVLQRTWNNSISDWNENCYKSR
ncbi:hypothetical protein CHS0354_020778 [Potamilus streckersoni]|uniref:Uncharacterized protein n=1 Tax=Potamilus streckersoni TaxID=2493646 RepID=A0AAE0VUB3_9BIVA|nr:hypothetical protein CHS0354_020778 [Potamilus streckersoni]